VPDRALDDFAARGPLALAANAPSRGRAFLALALLVTFAALAAGAHAYATSPRELRFPDAFDYAQMGRQISRGEGMTSLQTFPYALGWLAEHDRDASPPWPNVWRFPLPTWIRAASFALFGESDGAAIAPGLLFSAFTATLLFALGNRLGGPVAGLASAAVWIVSASQRELSTTGLSEPGAALLACAIALAALRSRALGMRAVALAGALLGLALLHRTNLAALAPVALLLALGAQRDERARRAIAFAASSIAVALPFWAYSAAAHGDPFVNLTTDRGLLRLALGRDPFYLLDVGDADGALARSLALYPSGWTWSWLRDAAPRMLGRDLAIFAPVALLALAVELRALARDPVARERAALTGLAATGLAATALVFAPIYPEVLRFYWPYAPLFVAAACAGALARVPQGAARAGAAVALVALFALLAPRERAAPLEGSANDLPSRDVSELAQLVAPGRVIASDVSFAVAWQAERASVRFVGNWDVLAAIDARVVRIDAIHLSPQAPARFAAPLAQPPLSQIFERVATQREATGSLWVARSSAQAQRSLSRSSSARSSSPQ